MNFDEEVILIVISTITLVALIAHYTHIKQNNICKIALTFDDGYYEQYYVLKQLSKIGIKATIYIPNKYIGKIFEEKYPIIDWEKIKELQRLGIEIGSHSYSHRNLSAMTKEEVINDIKDSIKQYTSQGIKIYSIALPYGSGSEYSDEIEKIIPKIRALGWDYVKDDHILPGLPITEENYEAFLNSYVWKNLRDQTLVLVFHRITNNKTNFRFDVDLSTDKFFELIDKIINEKHCEILRIKDLK